MAPAEAIRTGFAKSLQFSGRASRSEFWWFTAFLVLPFLAILFLATQILIDLFEDQYDTAPFTIAVVILVPWLTASLLLLPSIVRRGHDVGLRGPFVIVPFLAIYPSLLFQLSLMVPNDGVDSNYALFVGLPNLALLVLCVVFLGRTLFRRSDPRTNRFGPPPSEVTP